MDCHHAFKIIPISILLTCCYGGDTFSKTLTLREQWTKVVLIYPVNSSHGFSYNISYPVTSEPLQMVMSLEGTCTAGPVVEDREMRSIKEDEAEEKNGTDCKLPEGINSNMDPQYNMINTLDETNFWSGCLTEKGRYECHGSRSLKSHKKRVWGIGLLRCGEAVEIKISIAVMAGTLESCFTSGSVGDKTGSLSLVYLLLVGFVTKMVDMA